MNPRGAGIRRFFSWGRLTIIILSVLLLSSYLFFKYPEKTLMQQYVHTLVGACIVVLLLESMLVLRQEEAFSDTIRSLPGEIIPHVFKELCALAEGKLPEMDAEALQELLRDGHKVYFRRYERLLGRDLTEELPRLFVNSYVRQVREPIRHRMKIELRYSGEFRNEEGEVQYDKFLQVPLITVRRNIEYITINPFEESLRLNKTGVLIWGESDYYSRNLNLDEIEIEDLNEKIKCRLNIQFAMDGEDIHVNYVFLDMPQLYRIESEPYFCNTVLERKLRKIDERALYVLYSINDIEDWPKYIYRAYFPRTIPPAKEEGSKSTIQYSIDEVYACHDYFSFTLLSITNGFEMSAIKFPDCYHFTALKRLLCKDEENIFVSLRDRQIKYNGPLLPQSSAGLLWRKKINVDTESRE
jgi:hypothetical protein